MEKTKERFIAFRDYVFHISDVVIDWMKQYRVLFLIYLGIGIVVFFMLISQNLVNSYDGLWHNSAYLAGRWELSLGRWFWPFLDRLRFGMVSISINSVLALILISCGNVLLVDLFQIKHKFSAILVGALFIATPVICDSLSYCYMAVTFGVAYLLGVASAYCALKIPRTLQAIIAGGFLMSWSMGNYQAYFGVTCIILLTYFIKKMFQDAGKSTVGNLIVRCVGNIVVGGVLYKGLVTVVNAVFHVELSSYKGANNISLKSIIVNLPERIPVAYKEFYDFFFTNAGQGWLIYLRCIYLIAFVITAFIIVCKMVSVLRKDVLNGVLCILAVLFIPLACNGTVLLTTTGSTLLMAGGMALLFPLLICLFDDFMSRRLLYSGYLIVLTGMLWLNICIVNNDQLSMREGRTSTVTIAQNIITELINKGYIGSAYEFAFVGLPAYNNMFYQTTAFEKSSPYARFGDWWRTSDANRYSWEGILEGYCGVKFDFCSDEQYEELVKKDEIKEMECFPENGSIKEVDDVIVVKVSERY